MSDKEVAKKAYEQAETELREKQISEVKEIVKRTLERITETDKDIDRLQEKKKYLKLDLEDLKEGRLDRIEERQEKDPKAKTYSLIVVIKERERIVERVSPWYVPYQITWATEYVYPTPTTVYCTTANSESFSGSCGCSSFASSGEFVGFSQPITGSVARDFAPGTYQIGDKIVHLR